MFSQVLEFAKKINETIKLSGRVESNIKDILRELEDNRRDAEYIEAAVPKAVDGIEKELRDYRIKFSRIDKKDLIEMLDEWLVFKGR